MKVCEGSLHKLVTSSGKTLLHASTRKDGATSGEDRNVVNEGKNDCANSLLIADAALG